MKQLVIILPLLFLAFSLSAQFSISGNITTQENVGVPGAGVTIKKGNRVLSAASTDASGAFLISLPEPGNFLVQVTHIEYEPVSKVVAVTGEVSYSPTLKRASYQLQPFEIVGRSEDAVRELTGAATIIGAHTIDLVKPVGTQEILERTPGVVALADDGFGNSRISVGMRGLNPRRSSRILFLEDGVPIQPAIYLYPEMYYNPPVERIDKVEVIKGPALIKYGPQTMAGVINYITLQPGDGLSAEAAVSAGNNDYFSAFTRVGGSSSEIIKPEVQLLYKRGSGFRENNDFQQMNGTLKLKYAPKENRKFYFKLNVNKEDQQATYTGLTEYSFKTNPRFNPKNNDEFNLFRVAADVISDKVINANSVSTTRIYSNFFQRYWWREQDIFIRASELENDSASAVPWYTSGDLVRTGNGISNFGNLRKFYVTGVQKDISWKHSLISADESSLNAGARIHWERYIDDKKKGFSPVDREGVYYTTDSAGTHTIEGQSHHYETMAFAAWVEETWRFRNLTIAPGVRIEAFEQEKIDRLNNSSYRDRSTVVVLPGIGFNYNPSKFALYGGVHRGFTPPTSSTLSLLNFGADDAGLDLRAEKSFNSELGFRGSSKLIDADVCAFDLEINDLVAAGRGTAFKNLGKVRTYGIESVVSLDPERVSDKYKPLPVLSVNYTWMRSVILSGVITDQQNGGVIDIAGNELPYVPEHTLTVTFSKQVRAFELLAEVRSISHQFTDFENIRKTGNRGDTGPIPAFSYYNASIAWHVNGNWSLYFSGKNITDKIYIGSRLHSNPGQPEAHLSSGILPGARRQLTLTLKFKLQKQK